MHFSDCNGCRAFLMQNALPDFGSTHLTFTVIRRAVKGITRHLPTLYSLLQTTENRGIVSGVNLVFMTVIPMGEEP
jgi:hypothetical protein